MRDSKSASRWCPASGWHALVGVGITLALLVVFVLCFWLKPAEPLPAPVTSLPVDAPVPVPVPVVAAARAQQPPSPDRGLMFTSAENTMASQLELLARGDADAFAATFSVPVSAEQFAICKKRMQNAHLSPDWEMAEHTTENGQRVTRVSIFGKGETGFYEVNGRYVADRVWCVPLW